MPGRFIISFDCEGKWGMADHITRHHDRVITGTALIRAYEKLLGLLAAYEVPATFAFVMGFVLSGGEREQLAQQFCDVKVNGRNWMRNFRAAEEHGKLDGWFCPEAFELVRSHAEHEIACHGFRHIPLAEGAVSEADARFELGAARLAAELKRVRLQTFVFPRNQVGHVELLKQEGYIGYRTAPKQSSFGGRLADLGNELCVWEKAQPELSRNDTIVSIPSGYFLNWRAGIRQLVPRRITALRWQSIIEDAIVGNRVTHVWLHPHNIITGPETFDTLERLLAQVVEARTVGTMRTLTQLAFCEEVLARQAERADSALIPPLPT
jgi:peptidoglycan/xylan/chitin deacetylase (PgdA/CDA1 family)